MSAFPDEMLLERICAEYLEYLQTHLVELQGRVDQIHLSYVPRALAARETRGFIKLVADRRTNRLVGAHILGTEAGESLNVLLNQQLIGSQASHK